ncbi:MAG TPA: YidC/Oxa1 family membrane protein insertase [Candidatus Borkfalkia avicola]|uniref:YidC/Oxa1 family membrane protein insertase n=1 Tax=Candidatus Borkfalkia avicola TaxID=2838503 RepID=A0A9D2D6E5_9FIRM|nr:YidC/Oxa1 family membrane protein insertase [Candidatus Borkfalkia avicola]
MLNLLNTIINLSPADFGEGLNWLGRIIQWIVEIVPNIGLGIVLFTLILKVITLPLDVYSKASMRKNSLKMEKMRPQLEKLQKQYQNDQKMYNQKMMEMYKKNGYSMFGACLPMIVTLVVFMIVLGSFSDYSQFTNVDVYRQMKESYNGAVLAYAAETEDVSPVSVSYAEGSTGEGGTDYTRTEVYDSDDALITVTITRTMRLGSAGMTDEELGAQDWSQATAASPIYNVKQAAVEASGDETVKAALEWAKTSEEGANLDAESQATLAMQRIGRNAAEAKYREGRNKFLWVKNIWLPDTSYQHPVQLETGVPEDIYNEITMNLAEEKGAANGYYILIIVSIGTMFLSQFIISRSQKAQNELQTADGRGKTTQKVMMIVMPIIFGIFSFFYSAGFSIYMVTSNVFGILSTVTTNFFIDRKFKKIEEREIQEKYNKRIPQSVKKPDERSGGKKK